MAIGSSRLIAAAATMGRRLVILAAASLVAFAVLHAMPGDPVETALLGWGLPRTEEAIAFLRREWGLDRSWVAQYGLWLERLVSGDWGRSIRTGRPLLDEFGDALPISLVMGCGGLVIGLVMALPLGFFAARHPGGVIDQVTRSLSVISQSVPLFCMALGAIWLFAAELRLIRPFTEPPFERLLLPTLLIALYTVPRFSRVYRRELLLATTSLYCKFALTKGLSPRAMLWRHAHPVASAAMLAAVVSECGWVIGGTATAEVVFSLPGISLFVVQSVGVRDYFVLQFYVVIMAAWMLAIGQAADAARAWLDPRTDSGTGP